MADQTNTSNLWKPKTAEETKKIYADWADSYESDVTRMAYATPGRVAKALADVGANLQGLTLDFGCGTGLSGEALASAGFNTLHGTDISEAMLEHAEVKKIYEKLWVGIPGDVGVAAASYSTVAAIGAISLGAAPPEMVAALLEVVEPGGHFGFSYNDPTLNDETYIRALDNILESGAATVVFREHGPHLSEKVTGADVIVLRKA